MKKRELNYCPIVLICLSVIVACAGVQTSQKPEAQKMTTCPNCGMILKDWAHTNYEFINSDGHFRTCSIHCVADMSKKSGEQPRNVQVALHLKPEIMIPADKAVYVIGSKEPGTMTAVSKLAFESKEAAEKFMADRGGKIGTFSDAFAAATEELPKAKAVIENNRKNKGKIVEPSEQDRCVVCNMAPSKYPKNNAQLITADKKRFHLCSTQCLFEFLKDPPKHGTGSNEVGDIWVHDYVSGRYIFGKNAYYAVGSKILGPMGYEAIAFDLKSEALEFAQANGGRILKFTNVTIDKIKAK